MQLEVITNIKHSTHQSPILFVHGAWHAAWCWENFLPYFVDRGYAAYAVSLRGHGASEGRNGIRWYSAAHDYVADIAQVIQTFPQPPIGLWVVKGLLLVMNGLAWTAYVFFFLHPMLP
jgi:pimeloyl-ACP methyl ester carboxylesterase